MIGIDTNILVRFLTQDDPVQARRAERLLTTRCSATQPGWISVIVLCEVFWVLVRGYRYPREQIISAIAQLLRTAELEIEDSDLVREALERFASVKCDFADALIGLRNQRRGASQTYTFDQNAATLPEFKLVTGK
jgi:predicted nucleic-acid-binding protein